MTFPSHDDGPVTGRPLTSCGVPRVNTAVFLPLPACPFPGAPRTLGAPNLLIGEGLPVT